MTAPLDFNHVQTQDGRAVIILCMDAPGEYPVIGYFTDRSGFPAAHLWKLDGRFLPSGPNSYDLMNVPKPKTKYVRWVNKYPHGIGAGVYKTEEESKRNANDACTACVKIEFEV